MFSFNSVFDSMLYRPRFDYVSNIDHYMLIIITYFFCFLQDIPKYEEVQTVLREEIVNPFRQNLFVRADKVMKLRELLDRLSSVKGLTSEEKDPEEFLNSLMAQILKEEPYLHVILLQKNSS